MTRKHFINSQLYKILNALGISVSYDTVIDTVDSMRKDLDGDLQKWKQVIFKRCC